jgi:hypothetical protein
MAVAANVAAESHSGLGGDPRSPRADFHLLWVMRLCTQSATVARESKRLIV